MPAPDAFRRARHSSVPHRYCNNTRTQASSGAKEMGADSSSSSSSSCCCRSYYSCLLLLFLYFYFFFCSHYTCSYFSSDSYCYCYCHCCDAAAPPHPTPPPLTTTTTTTLLLLLLLPLLHSSCPTCPPTSLPFGDQDCKTAGNLAPPPLPAPLARRQVYCWRPRLQECLAILLPLATLV